MPTVLPSGIGRFSIVRPLGSGGSGTVLEALDRVTFARVAIKELRDPGAASISQLKKEFRALSQLAHPSVVRFGELFEDGGRFYLTMELVEGRDFLEYVTGESGPPLPSTEQESARRPVLRGAHGTSGISPAPPARDDVLTALPVQEEARLRAGLRQLASGLSAIHAAGLVHRDVKPKNVLVTREGRVVLLDFGLAIQDDEVHRPELVGTAAYMAPEQLRGMPATPAADWYAFGVILYEGLTGRLPHAGTPIASLTKKMGAAPVPPADVVSGLPDDLCLLAVRLLETAPEDRPAEAEIFAMLGLDVAVERARASFRSQLHFARGVFVGRERELGMLAAALHRANAGSCSVVRVTGESGVGKSALVRQFVRSLRDSHPEALVLPGRCYECETLPFRGVDLVVDTLAGHLRDVVEAGGEAPCPPNVASLAEVFPVLRTVPLPCTPSEAETGLDPLERRRLAFGALRALLGSLSRERPVIVHVDDAQWMDAESAALLGAIIEAGDAPPLLLVLAERSAPGGVDAIVRGGRSVVSIDLGPLPPAEGELLAAELLGRPGDPRSVTAAAIAEQAAGHPLFIQELVLHGSSGREATSSLDEALRVRVEALDADARRLLEVTALASMPLSNDVLRLAADLPSEDYAWVAFGLRAEGLVTFMALDEPASVYHDRMRELVVLMMGESERRAAHARLGAAIETILPGAVDALSHHYFEAGERARAASKAREAAFAALQKLAFERAAALLELALRAEDDPLARSLLEEERGQALASGGRGSDAAEAFLRAASGRESYEALGLRRRAGEQLLRAGHVERGLQILRGILRGLGVEVPAGDLRSALSLAALLGRLTFRGHSLSPPPAGAGDEQKRSRLRLEACWTVALGIGMVHHLQSSEMLARTLLLALDAGDVQHAVKSACLLGAMVGMSGATARRIGGRLTALAQGLTTGVDMEQHAWLSLTAGVGAMGEWDFPAAEHHCLSAEAEFKTLQSTGAAFEVATAQAFGLWAMAFQGRLRAAAERLPDLLASARARGDRYALGTLTLSPLHLIGLAADQPERVRSECRAILAEWPEELACFQHMCAEYVLAQVQLYEGRGEAAWQHVQHGWTMLRRSHLTSVQFQRVDLVGLRGRAAVARSIGSRRSRVWVRRALADATRLEREGIGPAIAMGVLIRGAASSVQGDARAAGEAFEEARHRFGRHAMGLHAAVAHYAFGVVTREASAARAAEERLSEMGVTNVPRMSRVWVPGLHARPG